MTFITTRVVVGSFIVSALGGLTLGSLTYWMQNRENQVEKEHRGNLLLRIGETANAIIESKKIADKAVAEKHVDLVSSISSRLYAATSLQSKIEQDKLSTSYFAGYLLETTLNVSGRQPFIFRYTENLPVGLPKIDGSPYIGGFIFSGPSSKINDAEAREQILKGQYIRCSTNLPYKNVQSKSYEKMDVILTGTTDCTKCASFRIHFMNDIVMSAARIGQKETIDSSYPLSDTPVFEVFQNKFKQVGDLSEFPEATKKTVLLGNFTLCNFYSLQKTRLSNGSYKEVGAVVAGVKNPKVCKDLHFEDSL